MIYFSLFSFAVIPSLIWLLYYLRQDIHPEPKPLIARVFFLGAIFAFLGYFIQKEMVTFFLSLDFALGSFAVFFLYFQKFVLVAFFEELLKYGTFFFTVRRHSELDEPMDIIIYMITAALGFAALENFLLLSSMQQATSFEMAKISMLRFVSATLLHAITSGILGFFIICTYKFSKKKYLFFGLLLATVIHGTYNILAPRIVENYFFLLLFSFLFFCGITLSFFIKKAKQTKSTCLLK